MAERRETGGSEQYMPPSALSGFGGRTTKGAYPLAGFSSPGSGLIKASAKAGKIPRIPGALKQPKAPTVPKIPKPKIPKKVN